MDWFYSRCHPDHVSRGMNRHRLVIFWSVILSMLLYPVISMLAVQLYTELSGSYAAGHHSVLLINCPTEQTARDVARYIMEKRMAACVNILPRTSTMNPASIGVFTFVVCDYLVLLERGDSRFFRNPAAGED
ncbi:protein CutA homolog isoform X2 [Silurus meridionalis]|uniref:protein CutA homolog isoform X2 n=1 Tax=Silurus meridionalis TaxID=175797 RepID=UPI001EEC10F9|nr:protein CutA homolog isoform X2 [Silurus meridionalis]